MKNDDDSIISVPPMEAINEQRPTRREREKLVRRQEIIEAARIVFAAKGFSDTKLEDVAERAEFGKGTLYNYFPNKEALFASVILDSFESVMTVAGETLSSTIPFEEKIDRFITGTLRFFFNNPETMHLMMREAHHLRNGNPMMHLIPQLLTKLAETIAAEQKRKKVIANADPLELATLLMNMLLGQFSARVFRRICCDNETDWNCANGDLNFAKMFSRGEAGELEKEILSAAKLVHTVFFNGITRR
jgi:AcrR family transcriptional regulator